MEQNREESQLGTFLNDKERSRSNPGTRLLGFVVLTSIAIGFVAMLRDGTFQGAESPGLAARVSSEPEDYDLGTVEPERRTIQFTVRNPTPYRMQIVSKDGSCACGTVDMASDVPSSGSVVATYNWDLSNATGSIASQVLIRYRLMEGESRVGESAIQFRAFAKVRPIIELTPDVIRLNHDANASLNVFLVPSKDTIYVESVVASHPAFQSKMVNGGFELSFHSEQWGLGPASQELKISGVDRDQGKAFEFFVPIYLK